MSKRGADRDLTQLNADDEEEQMEQPSGPWSAADPSKLKQRVIVRARRKLGDDTNTAPAASEAPAQPTFNFFAKPAAAADTPATATATTETPAASAPTASSTGTPTSAAPASASSATPAPMTSFFQLAANLNADTWECSTCMTRNKNSLAKCAACEAPKPASSTADSSAATADKKDSGAITSAGFSFPGASFGSASATPSFSFGGDSGASVPSFGTSFFNSASSSAAAADGNGAAASTPSWLSGAFATSSALSSFSAVAASSSTSSIASFTAPSTLSIAAGSSTSSGASEQFKDAKAESSGEETDEIVWRGQTKVFVMKKVTVGGESKLVREEDEEDGGGGGGGEKKEEKSEEKEEGKAGEVVDKWYQPHAHTPAHSPLREHTKPVLDVVHKLI